MEKSIIELTIWADYKHKQSSLLEENSESLKGKKNDKVHILQEYRINKDAMVTSLIF